MSNTTFTNRLIACLLWVSATGVFAQPQEPALVVPFLDNDQGQPIPVSMEECVAIGNAIADKFTRAFPHLLLTQHYCRPYMSYALALVFEFANAPIPLTHQPAFSVLDLPRGQMARFRISVSVQSTRTFTSYHQTLSGAIEARTNTFTATEYTTPTFNVTPEDDTELTPRLLEALTPMTFYNHPTVPQHILLHHTFVLKRPQAITLLHFALSDLLAVAPFADCESELQE